MNPLDQCNLPIRPPKWSKQVDQIKLQVIFKVQNGVSIGGRLNEKYLIDQCNLPTRPPKWSKQVDQIKLQVILSRF